MDVYRDGEKLRQESIAQPMPAGVTLGFAGDHLRENTQRFVRIRRMARNQEPSVGMVSSATRMGILALVVGFATLWYVGNAGDEQFATEAATVFRDAPAMAGRITHRVGPNGAGRSPRPGRGKHWSDARTGARRAPHAPRSAQRTPGGRALWGVRHARFRGGGVHTRSLT
jgi:hypothetical protein